MENTTSEILNKLTKREREVLSQIANGSTSPQIATALGISVKTVETHRKNMQRKLDALNACHLIYKTTKANII